MSEFLADGKDFKLYNISAYYKKMYELEHGKEVHDHQSYETTKQPVKGNAAISSMNCMNLSQKKGYWKNTWKKPSADMKS